MREERVEVSTGRALARVASLFAIPFHAVDGMILTGDPKEFERHIPRFPADSIGLEAFHNHYHLSDAVRGLPLDSRTKRRYLLKLADALVAVWWDRMAPHLGERSVLFSSEEETMCSSDFTTSVPVRRHGQI